VIAFSLGIDSEWWGKDRESGNIQGCVHATIAQRSTSHLQEGPTRILVSALNPVNVFDALFPNRHL
jgi:hypothetical protein